MAYPLSLSFHVHMFKYIYLHIQWAQTKLVHMTLGNTSVLCTSLVCAHCILFNLLKA